MTRPKRSAGPLIASEKLVHPDGLLACEIVRRHVAAMVDELRAKSLLPWVDVRMEAALVDTTAEGDTWQSYAHSEAFEVVLGAALNYVGAERTRRCTCDCESDEV